MLQHIATSDLYRVNCCHITSHTAVSTPGINKQNVIFLLIRKYTANSMPRKKEEESDEESEDEHNNTETDDEQEGNDQDENDEDFILEKEDTNGKDRKGPTKKRDLPKDQEGDFGDDLPSYLRVTDKGGYAHTKLSRLRISHANKGNEPWNKGKNRSGQDKARISAGVRARNQALLEAKLKRLGMTQEEWKSKKKELKYVRERLRRARLVNKKKAPIDIRTMVVDDIARGETSVSKNNYGCYCYRSRKISDHCSRKS